jgi:hypothetical protein
MSTVAPVSQETAETGTADRFLTAARFLEAWKDGVQLTGPSLFGCQVAKPADATHWHQLAPKLDAMRKALPNRSQADAAFAAAMASLYNATEGHRLATKAGAPEFGRLVAALDPTRRAVLAELLANFTGW